MILKVNIGQSIRKEKVMKHKKMKQKRHKLAIERKNVSGEPGELIAKRYFMYLKRFQAVGFLNPLQIRLIAETFAHIPTSYFFDENRNDWWNYYQMDVDYCEILNFQHKKKHLITIRCLCIFYLSKLSIKIMLQAFKNL